MSRRPSGRPPACLHCSGELGNQLSGTEGWSQYYAHVTAGLLWIRRMLVTRLRLGLSQLRRLRLQLFRLVLPLPKHALFFLVS